MTDGFETVWTLWYYCDGPREGVADYNGYPHVFVSEWNEEADDYGNAFLLKPIDDDTFQLVMEHLGIFRRWEAAVSQGLTTFDTGPELPEDRNRHEELRHLLRGPVTVDPARAKQWYPAWSWRVEQEPAVNPGEVLRLAAEFCASADPSNWDGYMLPLMAVRWSAIA
jgi:hypothetical protein